MAVPSYAAPPSDVPTASPSASAFAASPPPNPLVILLDTFIPGFSLMSGTIASYTSIDLSLYLPHMLLLSALYFGASYMVDALWSNAHRWFMSVADVRVDDEIYNMVMAWVAIQPFAARSRRFVANTSLNSRVWYLWYNWDDDEGSDDDEQEVLDIDDQGNEIVTTKKSKKEEKTVHFTPSFGTHWFWYEGRLMLFSRQMNRDSNYGSMSQREELSISSFGRNPAILKALLDECRINFLKQDANRTVIYRGALKPGGSEPTWTRCVSRVNRPFSTVVLDEQIKTELLADMKDYLHPYTRRWYSNRGIPYRRGYLLYGPPGTGKSSLSFAIAGYFKLKIYIVSLNSAAMSEENLSTLFADLPKRCVVLLEDIDTAGLTHTRRSSDAEPSSPTSDGKKSDGKTKKEEEEKKTNNGRISLSGLLNVLDGVASQEGRVLIMTTNHIENLDEALIRPGRVDMMVKFQLASRGMMRTIFQGLFTTLEGDIPPELKKKRAAIHVRSLSTASTVVGGHSRSASGAKPLPSLIGQRSEAEVLAEMDLAEQQQKKEEDERIGKLAEQFAAAVPEDIFSPAEIQGYLLKWKRSPQIAVDGAKDWTIKTLEEKKRKKIKDAEEAAKKLADERAESETRARKEKEEADKQKTAEASVTQEKDKAQAAAVKTLATGENNASGQQGKPPTNGITNDNDHKDHDDSQYP